MIVVCRWLKKLVFGGSVIFNKNISKIFCFALVMTTVDAWSQMPISLPSPMPPPTAEEVAQANADNLTNQRTGNAAPATSSYSDPSITDQAKTTSANEGMGGIITKGIGIGLGYMGGTDINIGIGKNSGTPGSGTWDILKGIAEIGMGYQALDQSAAHFGTSGYSGGNADYTSGNGSTGASSSGASSSGASTSSSGNTNVSGTGINPGSKAVSGFSLPKGFKVSMQKKTLTTPDGKIYKFSDFASKKSMEDAGFPSSAVAGALAAAQKVEGDVMKDIAKNKPKAATAESGDGGGGGSGAGAYGSSSGADPAYASGLHGGGNRGLGDGSLREPTSVAGMTKTFNGEAIGVGADDIFKMMNRRYGVKKNQDSFYSEAEVKQ